jgi:hypothetical protein
MSAAVDSLVLLRTMPNYPAPAVWASWGQGMNCTFKTIKDMRFSSDADFESLVVVVSASFTFGHKDILSLVFDCHCRDGLFLAFGQSGKNRSLEKTAF